MQHQPRNRRSERRRRVRWVRLVVALAGLAIAVFGLVKLIGYGIDLVSSRHTSEELRQVYYAEPSAEPIMETQAPTDAPTPVPQETPAPAPDASSSISPVPTQSPIPRLPAVGYPNNAALKINSRFRMLRNESKYIVGWLNIERLMDEPVVQRDDVFFLNHDAKGNPNVNGAVFMDSGVSLKTRPYTYILYGHNMKTGVMFGSLRNYENVAFYRSTPFITFDTMYEEGKYVIFAVGNVSTEKGSRNYVDFYALKSSEIAGRTTAMNALISASVYTCTVDLRVDDQLLVLVTCVEKDDERRLVAARRVRDGEDVNELKKMVERSVQK